MSNSSRVDPSASNNGVTVSFGEHFQASEQFDRVFSEGMALVERSAAYLDGDGRRDSKGLPSTVTVLYATESMRLTTRLLEMASWLLVRRALKEGEITEEEAAKKRTRIKLQKLGRPSHTAGFDDLPEGLRELVKASFALHDRIVQLDRAMTVQAIADRDAGTEDAAASEEEKNPVARHMMALEQAFGGSRPLPN